MAVELLLMNNAGQGYALEGKRAVVFLSPPYQTPYLVKKTAKELLRNRPAGFFIPEERKHENITKTSVFLSREASLPRVDSNSIKMARRVIIDFPASWVDVCFNHIDNYYFNYFENLEYSRVHAALEILSKAKVVSKDEALQRKYNKLRDQLNRKQNMPAHDVSLGERRRVKEAIPGKDLPIPSSPDRPTLIQHGTNGKTEGEKQE